MSERPRDGETTQVRGLGPLGKVQLEGIYPHLNLT